MIRRLFLYFGREGIFIPFCFGRALAAAYLPRAGIALRGEHTGRRPGGVIYPLGKAREHRGGSDGHASAHTTAQTHQRRARLLSRIGPAAHVALGAAHVALGVAPADTLADSRVSLPVPSALLIRRIVPSLSPSPAPHLTPPDLPSAICAGASGEAATCGLRRPARRPTGRV